MELTEQEFFDEIMGEYYEEQRQYNDAAERSNNRIFRAIENHIGKGFLRDLIECIEETEVSGKFALVKEPRGKFQKEAFGCIVGMWVDQWQSGTEADDYAGDIYVKLKDSLYLKMGYSS